MKISKETVAFSIVLLLLLIAGVYFFITCIPIKYTVSKDYAGMEYTSDMDMVSDSVKLHIYGYYYDYIWEKHNVDCFRGKFEISGIPETQESDAYFLIQDSLLEPNGNKKQTWLDYVMVDYLLGSVFMEKRFSKVFIELNDNYNNHILIFPAGNHEQAVEVYNELESALYDKNLFSE